MATYIIRAGEHGAVKIGRADDPEGRLAALQTGCPDELVLLRVIDTAFDAETIFHERFAHLRIRGEWFRFDPEMLSFVPPEPDDDMPISDVIRRAKRRSAQEAGDLLEAIWQHFRGIETKGRFHRRIARLLQVRERRIRALMTCEPNRRVDVFEIEALRAISKKLRREAKGVGPLFSDYEQVAGESSDRG